MRDSLEAPWLKDRSANSNCIINMIGNGRRKGFGRVGGRVFDFHPSSVCISPSSMDTVVERADRLSTKNGVQVRYKYDALSDVKDTCRAWPQYWSWGRTGYG